MESQNGSTDNLDVKTAIQIAKILAAAPEERLPMIMEVFSKAQVDISGLDELAEWRALRSGAALIDTQDFIKEITSGVEPTNGEYRIEVKAFNDFCRKQKVSARCARKHLAERGLIRTGTDMGKTNYTVPIWDEATKTNTRCVCIKAKTE